MTTKTLIMAVPFDPKRAVNAKRLAEATGGTVVWDQEQSIQDTFLRTLEEAGKSPVIILQDDVRLTSNWREKIEKSINERPGAVQQFFSIRKSDLEEGSRFVRGSAYLMNQCFYLPHGYAEELHSYAIQWWAKHPGHTGDDTCIAEFLKSRRERYFHHVPSLVQHQEWESAISSRSSKRQSPSFEE